MIEAAPARPLRAFERVLLWTVASAIAVTAALSWLPAAYDGTHFHPVGADSFYHARRILDTVANPGAFYQFDPLIHAPDGSLLTWPWAYDLLAAHAVRAIMSVRGGEALPILVYVPVVFALANCALLVAIGAHFGLRRWALYLLVACYVLSPLTRELHAVGQLDHHFLEQFFYFAALLCGSRWLRRPGPGAATAAGIVLGLAPAFHNGLFVLQILLVAAFALLWLRRLYAPGPSAWYFAAALVGTTLLILLPSEPLYRGETAFYYLGWFHLGAACATATAAVTLRYLQPTAPTIAGGALVLLGAALLAAGQIVHGGRFVFADMPALRDVSEARSLVDLLAHAQFGYLAERYSGLLFLLPVIWAGLAITAVQARDAGIVFACVVLAGGSFLMLQQLRLHYFGALSLSLPLLFAASQAIARLSHPRVAVATVCALVTMALWPGLRTFGSYPPLAGDVNYAVNRALMQRLGEFCRAEPGVVLARFGDGHYLRYHTDCRTIANNMIMTPQHLERIAYTEARFAASAADLRAHHHWIRYLYVMRQDNPLSKKDDAAVRAANPHLVQDLLLARELPPGFELLGETALERADGERVAIARILRMN